MSKIRGKDFAKTVVISPEENAALKKKAGDKQQATAKLVNQKPIMTGDVKGPPRGLGRWSVFFIIVLVLLIGIGVVAYSNN